MELQVPVPYWWPRQKGAGVELAPFLPPSLEVDVVTALQQQSTKAPFISADRKSVV